MEHYDPQASLQHWQGSSESLARMGLNPFGENMYRVVYAPSRRSMVKQSAKRHQWMRTYPQAGVAWVLEKWLSAYEFTGMGPEQWAQNPVGVLGPYPERGEYELMHIFYPAPASLGHIEKIIRMTEAGKKYRAAENMVALKDEVDRERKEDKRVWHDRLMDRTAAFGTAPISAYGGGRGTKTKEFTLTASDVRKPVKAGHMMARPTSQRYDVSHLIQP